MSSIAISMIAFLVIVVATLFGMFLRTLLNQSHLSGDSRDVMKIGTSMIATLVSLVLSLLIASAKSTYDNVNSSVIKISSEITSLDHTMTLYGLETREARDVLRRSLTDIIQRLWPKEMGAIALEEV